MRSSGCGLRVTGAAADLGYNTDRDEELKRTLDGPSPEQQAATSTTLTGTNHTATTAAISSAISSVISSTISDLSSGLGITNTRGRNTVFRGNNNRASNFGASIGATRGSVRELRSRDSWIGSRRKYSSMPRVQLRASDLKPRRAARVLVIDPEGKVLLFEYSHADSKGNDALADKGSYYTIPGGKALPSESFEECALRELHEETGITDKIPEIVIAVRQAPLMMSSGNFVLADERYYAIFVNSSQALDTSRWSTREKQNIKRVFWCTPADLAELEGHNLWPNTLREILTVARQHPDSGQLLPLQYRSQREQIGDVIVEVMYE